MPSRKCSIKNAYLAMSIQPGDVMVNGEPATIKLPDGCIGLMFVFDSEAAARRWHGEDVRLKELEVYSE